MTLSFFAQTAEAEKTPSGGSIAEADSSACRKSLEAFVGETAQRTLTEAEIDAHIKSLGDLATRSYSAGDKDAARGWMTAMYAAIAGRSPAHKARLQADLDKRIDEGVCYFMAEGDKARRRVG